MDIKGAGSDGKKFHEQSQSPLSIQSTLSQGAAQRPLIQPTKTYIRSKLLTVLPQFVNRRPPPRFAATGRLEVQTPMSQKCIAAAALLLLLVCTTVTPTAATAAEPEGLQAGPSSLLRRLLGSNFLGKGLSLGGGGSGAYASSYAGSAYAGTGYPGRYSDPYYNDPYYNRPYYGGSRRGYDSRRRNYYGRRLAMA